MVEKTGSASQKASQKPVSKVQLPPQEMDPKELPSYHQKLVAEGAKLLAAGQHEAAMDRLTRALEIQPTHTTILVLRSRCQLILGNTAGALADAEAVLKERPGYHRALLCKAEALYTRGDFEDALVIFHQGRRARPEIEGFHFGVVKATDSILSAVALMDAKKVKATLKKQAEAREREAAAELMSKPTVKPAKGGERRSAGMKRAKTVIKPRREDGLAETIIAHETQIHERNLLEELYEDKMFLEELQRDVRFITNAGSLLPDRDAHPSVAELVSDGLQYIASRVEFWRQRNPCAAAPAALEKEIKY